MDPIEEATFHQWLLDEGKASATIESYLRDVRQFQRYLEKKMAHTPTKFSRFYFTSYLKQLEKEKKAIRTINKAVTSLKVYNDWLYQTGQVEAVYVSVRKDKVKVAQGSEAEVSVLTEDQVERFLFYLEQETSRNKLMGYLLLYTGMRVSELVHLKKREIDWLNARVTVRGKGGKIREIPLRKDVIEVLKNYLEECHLGKYSDSEYVLVSQRADHIHRDTVRRWLSFVGQKLGFHIHPHMLRHTFCTRLLRNGVELSTVSKLAGHANVNMTSTYYIHLSNETKKSAVDLL